jgi:hypothetical protein
VKRGGLLSFLVGTISNVLVMEIGWTDVGSGGYVGRGGDLPPSSSQRLTGMDTYKTNRRVVLILLLLHGDTYKTSITVSTAH